jgi:uncharacterized YigZ family protein
LRTPDALPMMASCRYTTATDRLREPLHTLLAPCQHATEIRKSRFLAHAAPVASAAAALAFLQAVNTPSASHNCWAYRIGADYRSSDDGEPGGSAGRPILQAIDSQGLDRVMVVVTRWFGGIKLGVGGLLRAYGGTAAECLRQAPRVPIVATTRVRVQCGFADAALLKARLLELGARIDHEAFAADGLNLDLSVPTAHMAEVQERVVAISRGRAALQVLD